MRRILVRRFSLIVVCCCLSFVEAAHAGDAEKGKTIYVSRCAFCHGKSGHGDGPAGKALKPPPTNFTDPELWKNTKPETIEELIEHGKPGSAMLGYKGSLSHEQIADLLAYLQTFKPQQ